MRNISFMLTTQQILDRTKLVTRRIGWAFAKAGDQLQAVEKSQGLGKGGKINRLCVIRLIDVRQERLNLIAEDLEYGYREMVMEGFPPPDPRSDPSNFVDFFCSTHRGCYPKKIITRLEFEYL